MAGKGKKHHLPTEGNQEGSGEVERVEERSVIEIFMASQARREEERLLQAEKREERRAKEARQESLAAALEAKREVLAAEERMEARRLQAVIAAEEREELRRERAKEAEEERVEARALAKARRREEEANKQEEKKREELERIEQANKEQEEAARVASERMLVLQEEASQRAFDQQKKLVELQAELGERAAEAQREASSKNRRKDRAVSGIPNYREPDDVEDFLLTSERKLKAGEVPQEEWAAIIAAKLSGKVGTAWQEACVTTEDYHLIKGSVLKTCGYTPKLAGEVFFGFGAGSLKGMAADQVYSRGAQLLRRMVTPEKLSAHVEFSILKPWLWASVGRRCRMMLDARSVTNSEELLEALQDYLVSDGERTEGQAAVFKGEGQVAGFRRQAEGVSERKKGNRNGSGSWSGSVFTCFKCGKVGHKAADCWQGGGAPSPGVSSKPAVALSGKVTCYTCGVDGHKSTTCPRREGLKEGVSKPVRPLWLRDSKDTVLEGVVNGKGASLLLDSGAHISVVPENMVGGDLKTGESVYVRPFQSKVPLKLPTAKVKFSVEGMEEWEEVVALAPVERGKEGEVLYGLDLKSARGLDLVILANGLSQAGVNRVTTRAEGRQKALEESETVEVVDREKPQVKGPVIETVKKAVELAESEGKESAGEGESVADRPAGSSNPVSSALELTGREAIGEELPDLAVLAEEEVNLEEDVLFCLREGREKLEDQGVPPVRQGAGSRPELVESVLEDPTLEGCRELAGKGEQGYIWMRGLLYQARTTHMGEVIHLMVLPKSFRKRVLKMAHEGSGHLGSRKVKALLKQRFIWPGMGLDVIAHTRSCAVCQRCSKSKSRKVPLMERRVLTEPFEVMAFDLVDPFPKAKSGCRYVLTSICMSSKWPEAIPLKTMTARDVATGMLQIFARTGIPLQILTDQGTQFLSSLVTHLCKDLKIDKLRTAPYHPECNGVVERMHGTLGPMLTKASRLGLDWVDQLPFAMFALRSAPNRDSSFSPFQLVYGHRVRTPLDILHQGWAELEFEELETEEWSDWLVDRLEVWHGLLSERSKDAGERRKASFDKGTVDRQLEVGDKVLCRIPGMIDKLEESWHGPYEVIEKTSRVDYKVKVGKGKAKVLHVNNLKKYFERMEDVLRLALVAEDWSEDEVVSTKLYGSCPDFDAEEVVRGLRAEFPEVFSDLPGRADACSLRIDTGPAAPRGSHPYRIPNRLKEGVKEELDKLVELGIVVPSTSPWASPVVPVPKKDGTVRVCVDYRKLNEVTIADPYYMTTLEEILEKVGESRVMTKLDLAKGFYQVEVEPNSQEKTAFISPFGKFQFTRMPFGLKNAPAIFQRLMEVVLNDCYGFSAPYIDDILVFSSSGAEHVQHLRLVLEKLRKYGMTIKRSKCEFGKVKVEYLGHVIGGGELAVPAHRAAAMADYIRPVSKKQLRSFLGAAGYYRQFVEGFARLSSVLSPLTSKSAPSVVGWTAEGVEAFDLIKVSLVDVCCLTIPTQQDDFTLHTDASGAGIGATLNVMREGRERPVAYYSKQLQGAQHFYSATELEGLAIFKSVHFFSHYLFGCRFRVVTDHKALVSPLHSRILNRRLHGWMLQLLQFDFVIIYRPGSENSDADALSRQAWDTKEGEPWLSVDQSDQTESKVLRTAPELVGGDVGRTHIEEGGATSGVAPKKRKELATGSGLRTVGV